MQYRTATRLTDVRLVLNRVRYLFCDTDKILPEGMCSNSWGDGASIFSTVREDAVFLSVEEDEALLQVLLARHDFVISLKSSDYATYQATLKLVLNDKLNGFSGSEGGGTIGDYILQACVASNANRHKSRYSWEETLEEKMSSTSKSFKHLEGQMLYLTRVPEDIALMLWTRFVEEGSITYYELGDTGSISKLDLVTELSNTCTNFEATVEYGCITCGDRNGCLDYLSGGQLTASPHSSTRSLMAAKSLLTKQGLNYVPPSVVSSGNFRGVEDKLDFTGVNISCEKVGEAFKHHKLKYLKLKQSAKFFKEKCQKCLKVEICGTRGFAYSSWQDGYYKHSINEDYCSGAKNVEVTPYTLEVYIRGIFELLLYNAGFNSSSFGESLAEIPNQAASKIVDWVFKGSHLDKYASACIRYLEECPKMHHPASVIPVEIEQALKMLDLCGGYSYPQDWWSHGISRRPWIKSTTEYTESCFPGIPGYSKNKWVVMTRPNTDGRIASPRGYGWKQGSGVAESLDTSLYANMNNLKVKGRKPLKRFVTMESRMHLALLAIKMYVSPSCELNYGPFGAKKDFAPTSHRAWFAKNTKLRGYRWHYRENPADLGSTELVLDILKDIANTHAKYNMHSLEILSSLGELVDK
jgi:hypothetical protein